MQYRLIYSAAAQQQLKRIQRYIASKSSQRIADEYIERIQTRCEGLLLAPFQGTKQDHFRPGIRTTGFEGRVTIAFRIQNDVVRIVAIAYGGRQYESGL